MADRNKLFPAMPTVAYDAPRFGDFCRRGPVWLNVAYFAVKGLYDYGFIETAFKIRDTILGWVEKDDDDCIHEHYHAVTGEGLLGKQFSWSAVFTIEFILNIK